MAKLAGTNNKDSLTGTSDNDEILSGAGDDTAIGGAGLDRVEGELDSDVIFGGDDSDLAVGDKVGSEWALVDGVWVYDPTKLSANAKFATDSFDDTIYGGAGDDVVIGNGGNDALYGGEGEDLLNAGRGDDAAYGGEGADIINLDGGDDLAYGGAGADIINGGDGNDVMYGDLGGASIATGGAACASSFAQHAAAGGWSSETAPDGSASMTQMVKTVAGTSYEMSFDLAANTGGGSLSGQIEVVWNGEVIAKIDASAGLETHNFTLEGVEGGAELTFRSVPDGNAYTGPEIITDGVIDYYEKEVTIGGETVDVAAFAPGQASLYQVIDGQLKVFDTATNTYEDAGDSTGLKLNAIGFNAEDDLIYGIAKKAGVDSLGNPVATKDIVMMDAEGNAYRIGDGPTGDYVGDFDDSGNLWTFNSSMDRITKVDVDNLDANGDPIAVNYDIDNSLFTGRMYDIAYSAKENSFYAVEAPAVNGGEGKVHKIDLSSLDVNGSPMITSIPISGTLFEGAMVDGMVKGAYGAVFLDGEGNLYAGLNKGDHDLDGSTDIKGSIYKINADFDTGTAYAEHMAESQLTGSNDGAADPRSIDPFAEVDTGSDIVMTMPTITLMTGGDDDLRGGAGDDTAFGGYGDDVIHGGDGNDVAEGGAGADRLYGGDGEDRLAGGAGDDKVLGGAGNDIVAGGDGKDFVTGGAGDDYLSGGAGNDKLVGGSGEDIIDAGAGDDHMWGGNWWKDGSSDTFVIAGGGKDMIHDFEADADQIDLSAYGLEFNDLQGLMTNKGWATEIDLSGLDGGNPGDKLIIKSVDPDDLDESNFIL
ncbi:hypothetical protein GCM10007939_00450 [Amylibacter marinus]|uniref:DUF6923 domain-containing protein n=1 Tax=Amylibacter marinus TaxID=1475483 RepID=A0ABQ5VQT3_9RHOB|nr:calcium-binding protein [Amylibacter marinus]GLQ33762.1 hypothetical protein GCM10007939_00450 [Amylibacter marinus]